MLKFIVDHNVGKLVRWLRMLGYDTAFFTGDDDGLMVKQALAESRVILTRDSGIMRRRMITSGKIKAVHFTVDQPEWQMRQLLDAFDLIGGSRPFTLCLEDNAPLEEKSPAAVAGRVPPYVFKTQRQYKECPLCRRVYWPGTHWSAMKRKLEKMVAGA